ncbi:hypothetical protein HYR99_23105 [Candidatus Poribacteria bacterium]|nr:hypothetical protein [Candidatus Poribacteria bacterium]
MILFIANEPFSEEVNPSDPTIRRMEIRLRMVITEPTVSTPPPTSSPLEFVLDTGADYASVFEDDLAVCGISLAAPSGGWITLVLGDGSAIQRPMQDVTLWLYSNIPALANQPYRIDPNGGVVVLPARTPDMADLCSLLGMNPLLDGRLRIELNAETRRFSVWVPD